MHLTCPRPPPIDPSCGTPGSSRETITRQRIHTGVSRLNARPLGPYRVARVWDIASGRGIATFTGHSAQVVSIAWSPHGKRLASAALDGEAHIWNSETGGLLVELVGHEAGVSCIAWSPRGDRLATASLDGDARVWNSRTGQTLAVLKGHADWVRTVAWSPDGNRLATGGEDRVPETLRSGGGPSRRHPYRRSRERGGHCHSRCSLVSILRTCTDRRRCRSLPTICLRLYLALTGGSSN
jgi:WD40 repeat protein